MLAYIVRICNHARDGAPVIMRPARAAGLARSPRSVTASPASAPRVTCVRATAHLHARDAAVTPHRNVVRMYANGSGRGAYRQVTIRGVPNLVYSTRKVGRCRGGWLSPTHAESAVCLKVRHPTVETAVN